MAIMAKLREKILTDPLEACDMFENLETEEHDVVRENSDLNSRIQELEAEGRLYKKEIGILIDEIASLSEENNKLSQK